MSSLETIYVDAHCHLDLYPDMELAMMQCQERGVTTIGVTTTPRAWPRNLELARKFNLVRPALGIHPQLVGNGPSEISTWQKYLHEAQIIGEIGLDAGPAYFKTLDQQIEIFTQVLKASASAGNKVLSVHSVRSAKRVLDLVEKYLAGSDCRVIMHWFTGTMSETKRAIDLDCYFSVNNAMLFKEAHINAVNSIPLHRILTETDGPFTRIGSRPSTPQDIPSTVSAVAKAINLPTENLRIQIAENFSRLLACE